MPSIKLQKGGTRAFKAIDKFPDDPRRFSWANQLRWIGDRLPYEGIKQQAALIRLAFLLNKMAALMDGNEGRHKTHAPKEENSEP